MTKPTVSLVLDIGEALAGVVLIGRRRVARFRVEHLNDSQRAKYYGADIRLREFPGLDRVSQRLFIDHQRDITACILAEMRKR